MKKIFIAIVTLALLALDWTALGDIIQGKSNTTTEYVTLVGSVVVILALLSYSLKKPKK